MAEQRGTVDVFFSTQSVYCYCLIDRLLWLQGQGVEVTAHPVLGGVLRLPERFAHRDALETAYFKIDSRRLTEQLGLPYGGPDPSPIDFLPGPGWRAGPDRVRNTWLNRLFVASVAAGRGLGFLDHVIRDIWAGTVQGWDQPHALADALARADLDEQDLLAAMPEEKAAEILQQNAEAMYSAGHWGVPLMVYRDEPFYGQDRFDALLWRLQREGAL